MRQAARVGVDWLTRGAGHARRLLLVATVASSALYAGAAPAMTNTATARPIVSSFTPASGTPGVAVTVTGSRLTDATAVRFAGTAASFTVSDDAHIQTTVP